mmetsp:Transcript_7313/g.8012  ORF Transcript_7313/g.8012 Transcript_7313/m.8012 type:complete len:89 (+) Transcript_7313:54-320(+)
MNRIVRVRMKTAITLELKGNWLDRPPEHVTIDVHILIYIAYYQFATRLQAAKVQNILKNRFTESKSVQNYHSSYPPRLYLFLSRLRKE